MQDPFTTEKIIEIINGAADKSLEKTQSYRAISPEDTASFSEADIEKLLNETSDEIVRKEQVDYLSEQIKKRFLKIKSVSKENFNMFEVAMQCHKLVNEYRQLAKEKGWREIEQMFSKKENY